MNEVSFKKEVFDTFSKQVYGYVLALTHSTYAAEEVTQDIFIKLWLCRDALAQVEKLDSYIFSMAHNRTLNHLRKVSNQLKVLNSAASQFCSMDNNNVEERLLQYDYRHMIDSALQHLTPQRKLVYQLSRSKGLKQEEIAAFLKLSPNTVKNHLCEALRSIRRYMGLHGATILLLVFQIAAQFK